MLRCGAVRQLTSKSNKTSKTWMKRHVKDNYVRLAQSEGHVSRSYFKLRQLDRKFHLFNSSNNVVVDLGAAPGGWTSYVAEIYPHASVVVSVDLNPLDDRVLQATEAFKDFHFLQGDFHEVRSALRPLLPDGVATTVLSDMAPSFCGDKRTDAIRGLDLCERALAVAIDLLDNGGSFVGKYFSCPEDRELRSWARKAFKQVQCVKPDASRKESAERFLVCTGYRNKF